MIGFLLRGLVSQDFRKYFLLFWLEASVMEGIKSPKGPSLWHSSACLQLKESAMWMLIYSNHQIVSIFILPNTITILKSEPTMLV